MLAPDLAALSDQRMCAGGTEAERVCIYDQARAVIGGAGRWPGGEGGEGGRERGSGDGGRGREGVWEGGAARIGGRVEETRGGWSAEGGGRGGGSAGRVEGSEGACLSEPWLLRDSVPRLARRAVRT